MTGGVNGTFRAGPEHDPKSDLEAYQRLHYYVSALGIAISDSLQDSLSDIRRQAYTLSDPELQKRALKDFSDAEFMAAVKEILCIWLHMEALDQGGEEMMPWLLRFLRRAFGATDAMIGSPKAIDVMMEYEHCDDMNELCHQTSVRAAQALGFGNASHSFAQGLVPVLLESGQSRQQVLEQALTWPIESILAAKFS